MMWSSALTSRLVVAAALVCILTTGCAQRQAVLAPPLRGAVNLDVLVRHHPGWSGVGQYDAALGRLETAARQLPPSGHADEKMAILPALTPDNSISTAPIPGDLVRTGRRLDTVQQSLIVDLRQRRELERREQLRQERELREREASRLFIVSAGDRPASPDLELQLLQASVAALTKTVGNWDQSASPAPKLNALRAKVLRDRARLETLLAERARQRETAIAQRRDEIQDVLNARTDYVQAQQQALASRLVAEDDHLIAAQSARLTQERSNLLRALARPDPLAVPAAGNTGVVLLPRGPGSVPASLSPTSLIASEARLRSQRARWLKFLRDDTVAAAQDTAQGQRWDVTFGPPRPGDRDMTAQMVQALASGIWRL